MIPEGYRIQISFDTEKNQYIAKIPELGDLCTQAENRQEALTLAEQQIEQAIRAAAEAGSELPRPVDHSEYTGELTLTISPGLHRELVFLSIQDKIELNQLLSEMLSAAAAQRQKLHTRTIDTQESHNGKNQRPSRRGSPRNNRYFNIMDNKANFLEYVRQLEGGGSNRRGGGGRNR